MTDNPFGLKPEQMRTQFERDLGMSVNTGFWMQNARLQEGKGHAAEVARAMQKMHDAGMIREQPDGKVQLVGTLEQLQEVGIDLDELMAHTQAAQVEAEEEIRQTDGKLVALWQQRAYLEQQMGQTPVFEQEGMYLVRDPRGGSLPLMLTGKMLSQFHEDGYAKDYQLLSKEEIQALGPDAEVNFALGFSDEPHLPIMLNHMIVHHQGFVDFQR